MAAKPVFSARTFSVVLALFGLQGLVCLIALLLIPTDPSNTVFFGFSVIRLAMALALLIGSAALLTSAVLVSRNKNFYVSVSGILANSRIFLFLLAAGLFGVALSMNWPFAAPEFLAAYTRAFPLILFITLFCVQGSVLHLFLPGKEKERYLALAALTVLLVLTYLLATTHYSQINREHWLSDQDAMLQFVRALKDSKYTYTGSRDFMPGFPLLASPFMDTTLPDGSLFAQGKVVNILLSLSFLSGIFLFVRKSFNLLLSTLFVFIVAFTLFIYKAPYFQPELTYYFLSFGAFVLMLEVFRRPNFLPAAGVGLLLALAHYTKASALPAIALFFVAMIAQGFYLGFVRDRNWRVATRIFAIAMTAALAFLLPLSSYLRESKETYGSYFYNLNSSYYVWFDSFGKAKASDQTFNYAFGKPDVPDSELPSLQNYIRTHDLGEILDRFQKGFVNQASNWFYTFGLVSFPLLFLAALGALLIQRRQRAWALIKEQPVLTLFLFFFFAGYSTLFAWYGPIADYADRRFTYGLYLPLLFCIFLAMQALAKKDKRQTKSSSPIWLPAFYGGAAMLLAVDLLLRVPYQFLDFHWFGK